MRVSGPVVMATASAVKTAGEEALATGAETADLTGVTEVDSSAVAVLLAWTRLASEQKRPFAIIGAPEALRSLAALYGVAEMLPLA
jgi:phospholipid transport system transporter-binding protein